MEKNVTRVILGLGVNMQTPSGEFASHVIESRDSLSYSNLSTRALRRYLPPTPVKLPAAWLRGVGDPAKELTWLLLRTMWQADHWGAATVVDMAMHMNVDELRQPVERVGFSCYSGTLDRARIILRSSIDELEQGNYVVLSMNRSAMAPTVSLINSIKQLR